MGHYCLRALPCARCALARQALSSALQAVHAMRHSRGRAAMSAVRRRGKLRHHDMSPIGPWHRAALSHRTSGRSTTRVASHAVHSSRGVLRLDAHARPASPPSPRPAGAHVRDAAVRCMMRRCWGSSLFTTWSARPRARSQMRTECACVLAGGLCPPPRCALCADGGTPLGAAC